MDMRSIKQIDVTPTMARALGIRTPPIDGMPIDEVEGWGCDRVVLAIVDSLGYGLYKALEQDLPKMRSMAEEGLLLKAKCVASSTTPAIASILTGLMPQNHGISNTTQALAALKRDPKLLVAHFVGIDRIAHRGGGIAEIREAASTIDGYLGELVAAIPRGTMMIICGDHPLHAGLLKGVFDSKDVALILREKGDDKKSFPLKIWDSLTNTWGFSPAKRSPRTRDRFKWSPISLWDIHVRRLVRDLPGRFGG